MIDFSQMDSDAEKAYDLGQRVTVADMRGATHASIDRILGYFKGLSDADVTFDPFDPLANDPDAVPGEELIGWNLAHLVVHTTASSEEGAAVAAILARGIPFQGRLRYETPWETVTTVVQCVQRLEESRRMRIAALDMFPDVPFTETVRTISENFTAKFGVMNANAAFLFVLHHEVAHYPQFEDVRQQALKAREISG